CETFFIGKLMAVNQKAIKKLVELEFQCPCNPKWNGLFSSAFFIIPAIMAFILMLIIQGRRCDESSRLITQGYRRYESSRLIIQGCRWDEWFKKTVSSSVPAIVWLISLFLDGQYFACAMTDWEGRFVLVDKAAPQKWCKPISEGNFTTQELMLRSQEWIFKSQVS
uniref:Uncharacterized protein n=1 Tax=Takifugu rubripes TaxID=31033 RepID=A0A674MAT7_TAKRU